MIGEVIVFFVFIGANLGQSCGSQGTEALCSGTEGCKWTNGTGTCIGGSCGGTPTCAGLDQANCVQSIGCLYVPTSAANCEGTAKCTGQITETGCEALSGCLWSASNCVGAPNTCSGTTAENCKLDGCTYTSVEIQANCGGGYIDYCENATTQGSCGVLTGCVWKAPEPAHCVVNLLPDLNCGDFEDWGINCSQVPGCTYSGQFGASCTGEINYTGGAAYTTKAECNAMMLFYWEEEDEGFCQGGNYAPKQCIEFTTNGKVICQGVQGCTWTNPVPVGCGGTPENSGDTDCGSLTSDGNETCTGNQCTWVEAGQETCSGSTMGLCSNFDIDETMCGVIGGCTFKPEVTTGLCIDTYTGSCVGGTPLACTSVNGCTWTEDCSSVTQKTGCDGNGVCTWSQLGTCGTDTDIGTVTDTGTETDKGADTVTDTVTVTETDADDAFFVYAPVFAFLLLTLLL